MSIIYISDFDLHGSGYMNIAVALCNQLVDRGLGVMALGLGYKGQEHDYPFTIVPAELWELAPMVSQLEASGVSIEAVVVSLDIPLQERLLKQFGAPSKFAYVGLFPVEAPPLCKSWAMNLLRMDVRLVMSEFGCRALEAQMVPATYIPIGTDTQSWKPPTLEERAHIRKALGMEDDTFVVLTVADNQERKNLSKAMEIFADFAVGRKAHYMLVTREDSPVGWKLQDYAMELGIMGCVSIWNRGIPFKSLWSLFAAADAFLLTSKAEGLAMPVLEAMACHLPVVGTGCTAIAEHLAEGRGLTIYSDYVMRDTWGNSERHLASREEGCRTLELLAGMSDQAREKMLDRAYNYVQSRTWDKAGQVLADAIDQAMVKAKGRQGEVIGEPEKKEAQTVTA